MDPTKILIISQFIVQAILIVLVLVLFFKDRKKDVQESATEELRHLLAEIQRFNEELTKVLQDKTTHVSRLMEELDAKIREAQGVKAKMDVFITQENSTPKTYTRQDVLRLAQNGLNPLEIAQVTSIPIGEIQLILKVVS